jgi:hypothetical protein
LAQIFPEWTNKIPLYLPAVLALTGAAVVGFFWYYGSPNYTDVGYRPEQPTPYSHKLHAGDLGMDCRYCHSNVERSAVANIPSTKVCMNCHTLVKNESEKLQLVRDSWATGQPIEWIRIHKLPDYAYFNHRAHLRSGVGCESCHGNVAAMEVVEQKQPLSMSWCLDCHRNPAMHLRPADAVTRMNWIAPANQLEIANALIKENKIAPPLDCSGCHR